MRRLPPPPQKRERGECVVLGKGGVVGLLRTKKAHSLCRNDNDRGGASSRRMQRGKIHGQSSEKGFFSREQCTKKSALHTYGFACRNRTLPCRKKTFPPSSVAAEKEFFLFFSRRFLSLTSSSSYSAFFPPPAPRKSNEDPARNIFAQKKRGTNESMCSSTALFRDADREREREREEKRQQQFRFKAQTTKWAHHIAVSCPIHVRLFCTTSCFPREIKRPFPMRKKTPIRFLKDFLDIWTKTHNSGTSKG